MIEIVIPYRTASIGAFDVRRVLPFRKRRSVGPFVFVDDMGPVEIVRDQSLDVLSHPHIGLATVTYLFSGQMTHRDSLGTVQIITPGDVNWMTAGRGIVHSERVSDAPNGPGEKLVGLQTWVALPESHEESDPAFAHHGGDELPVFVDKGIEAKVILGSLFGEVSPVATLSNPVYAECTILDGIEFKLAADVDERGVYVLTGSLSSDGQKFGPGNLIVFQAGSEAIIKADGDLKMMLIGGDRLEKPRHMWWNFVSTSPELIENARDDWRRGNFTAIPNETGFVPLPEGSAPKPIPQPF
ncbi:MAG TPA: pirin family protein [Pyrinomonadaceae bacterium]|nr:pirin family protein [Pyrinomonadaceae bacterium]